MKINIGYHTNFRLAEMFAHEIHAAVIRRHLCRVGCGTKYEAAEDPFREVCAAIRSITDPFQRREFVSLVKYLFQKKRTERDTPPKWQTYVAQVEESEKRAKAYFTQTHPTASAADAVTAVEAGSKLTRAAASSALVTNQKR